MKYLFIIFLVVFANIKSFSQAQLSVNDSGLKLTLNNGKIVSDIDPIAPAFVIKEMFNEMAPMMMETTPMVKVDGKWVAMKQCPSDILLQLLSRTLKANIQNLFRSIFDLQAM